MDRDDLVDTVKVENVKVRRLLSRPIRYLSFKSNIVYFLSIWLSDFLAV